MSLLSTALGLQRKRKPGHVTDEEVELATAYLRGEITGEQVNLALGDKTGTGTRVYVLATRVVKTLIAEGKLMWTTEPKLKIK